VELQQAIGEAVKHFRSGGHGKHKSRYTQEELTERVRQLSDETEDRNATAPETISRIENGHANPTTRQIYWICKALNVSLTEFFRYVEGKGK